MFSAAYEVMGCGTPGVDGTYVRCGSQVDGSDVFCKQNSPYALMRKGADMWALVDLRGSKQLKWSLRTVELYNVVRIPSGPTPPLFGWGSLEGQDPPPILKPGKSHLINFFASVESQATWSTAQARSGPLKEAGRSTLSGSRSEPFLPPVAPPVAPATPQQASPGSRPGSKQGKVNMRSSVSMKWAGDKSGARLSRPRAESADSIDSEPDFGFDLMDQFRDDSDESPTSQRGSLRSSLGGKSPRRRASVMARSEMLGFSPKSQRRTHRKETRTWPTATRDVVCVFRLLLIRPNARIPWGFQWDQEPYEVKGSRIIKDIIKDSPLDRYNVWQEVNGRKALQVQKDDQLIRVDGKWAYSELEVGSQDGDQAAGALAGETLTGRSRCIVLEFARKSSRPMAPEPPSVEVWDSLAALIIHWVPPSGLTVLGWAVVLRDVDHRIWYNVDGETQQARPTCIDVATFPPHVVTACVAQGLLYSSSYAACVAVLTQEYGWSTLSSLSRPASLRPCVSTSAPLPLKATRVDDDDFPSHARFSLPSDVVPLGTAPIPIEPVPREFLSARRWVRMQVVVKGSILGLHLEAETSRSLTVTEIEPWSPMDMWNQEQESATVHGTTISRNLQEGDVIVRLNGLSTAKSMLAELERAPEVLVFTFERQSRGTRSLSDEGEDQKVQTFNFDFSLDPEVAKTVEDNQWHVLLKMAEGQLCLRLVESSDRNVEDALLDAIQAIDDDGLELIYPKVLKAAEKRIYFKRQFDKMMLEHNARKDEQGQPTDEARLIHLRNTMADTAQDDTELGKAITSFRSASLAIRTSSAGTATILRALALQALWRWRRKMADSKRELEHQIKILYKREAEVQDEDGNFQVKWEEASEQPLFDLGPLTVAIDKAKVYLKAFEIPFQEAFAAVRRLEDSNRRYAAMKRIYELASSVSEDELALTAALDAAEEIGVTGLPIEEGRQRVIYWHEKHLKQQLHDELFRCVQALKQSLASRDDPDGGAEEEALTRKAIAEAALPQDEPLVIEAWSLLQKWEAERDTLSLRARLAKALALAEKGFNSLKPEVGDELGTAMAELVLIGVGPNELEKPKKALETWLMQRRQKVQEYLETAVRFNDEVLLEQSVPMAHEAGVEKEEIRKAEHALERIRAKAEVTGLLNTAMEGEDDQRLANAIQRSHGRGINEMDLVPLRSASLEAKLRHISRELQEAVKLEQAEGLELQTKDAQALITETQEVLATYEKTGIRGPPVSTLKRDLELAEKALPGARELLAVYNARNALNQVLTYIRTRAAELPEVIAEGEKQLQHGLEKELLEKALAAKQEYDTTMKGLHSAIHDELSPLQIKEFYKKATLSGCPQELLQEARQRLLDFPGDNARMAEYAKVEIEYLVAMRESETDQSITVDRRFTQLQDTAQAAEALRPPLEKELFAKVPTISMALAAESNLKKVIVEAEAIIRVAASSEKVEEIRGNLEKAMLSVKETAGEEVRKMVPEAEQLSKRLEMNSERRKERLQEAIKTAEDRTSSLNDLLRTIVDAREAFVPPELLQDAYSVFRRRKLAYVNSGLRSAVQLGHVAVAHATYLRGLGMRAVDERDGLVWRDGTMQALLSTVAGRPKIVQGEFRKDRCGGSFGTSTWRQNPYYMVLPRPRSHRRTSNYPPGTGGATYTVTVALAEAAEKPATLGLHVVRNSPDSVNAGCGQLLAPGFEVVAEPQPRLREVPHCEFQLPVTPHETFDAPFFIVPSAARGEEGPFNLVVYSPDPIQVIEVTSSQSEQMNYAESVNLIWEPKRPYSSNMGGGRFQAEAPMLSWYRNPQFRVRRKPPANNNQDIPADDPPLPPPAAPPAPDELGEALLSVDTAASEVYEDEGEQLGSPSTSSECSVPSNPGPLLMAVLNRGLSEQAAAAIHLCQNLPGNSQDGRLAQNPLLHRVLAHSGSAGNEYSTASEIGCVCKLPNWDEEPIIVVPSLELASSKARYTLHLMASEEIIVERLQ